MNQEAPVLTISQLTNAIKYSLESSFPNVWIQGEVSNAKLHTSGHFYFSLKDANAQISAIMYRADASQLKAIPKDGASVIVRGEINVYPAGGKYQIIVREMKQTGLGELLLKLEELKIKLHKLGWFKPERKKPLPKMPRRIGIVTSPTGAAIQDILNILNRRFSGVHVIINPVKVQGEGAAKEIAQAIRQFNEQVPVDVMIVGRGGGSIEDLFAFNEEIVAQAIYESRIPIISAVGHETDHCIADYVADVRAPTPSAAAELVIAEKAHHLQTISLLDRRFREIFVHRLKSAKEKLESLKRQIKVKTPDAILGPWMQRLDMMRQDIDQTIAQHMEKKRLLVDTRLKLLLSLKPTAQIKNLKEKLSAWEKALKQTIGLKLTEPRKRLSDCVKQIDSAWERTYRNEKLKFLALSQALQSVNPKNLIKKGYAILFSEKDSSVITSIHHVEKDQDIKMILADGELIAKIKEIKPT